VNVTESIHEKHAGFRPLGENQEKLVREREEWSCSSPTVANSIIYIGSVDHKLYAFGIAA
jgi:hypothetical protein